MSPIVIGVGHYSRTGKDTFANALVEYLNKLRPDLRVGRRSFASKLKQITAELYSWAGLMGEDYYNDPEHEHERDLILPAMGLTPVEIWVKFGTPAVRKQVYEYTWIDYLLKTDQGLDVMIIPDVRFLNEVDAIRKCGGYLIKMVRDGYGPKMTVADLALCFFEDWDNVIGDDQDNGMNGIQNIRSWAYKYASVIANDAPLSHLNRSEVDIKKALSVQKLPTQEEVLLYERTLR